MSFTGVVADQVPAIWHLAFPHLIRASDRYHTHDMDELYNSLIARERQLWVAGNTKIEAALVTQIKNKTCHIELCGGRGLESIPFLRHVEKWAKKLGCTQMELNGRVGWKKALPDYRLKSITLKKDL